MEWESLSLTCVEYQRDDLVGKLMALFSLSPLFISISFATFIFCRRDTYSILFFVGMILNFLIVQVEKIIVREPRPPGGPGHRSLFEYGMPSMHCQFISFFTLFLSLCLVLRWRVTPLHRLLYLTALSALLLLTCVSRVYLVYHTASQVVIGAFMGALFGVIWYYFTNWVSPYVNRVILHSNVAKYFCVRTLSHLEDAAQFEYDIVMRVLAKHK